MKKRVCILFETCWDRLQLDACRPAWSGSFDVDLAPPSDHDCPWDLDVTAHLAREAERLRGTIDGVFSTSDYPGATAAATLATALGLPGSEPAAVLRASQKHASRLAQREVVPEAVPPFGLVDPDDPATWDPAPGFPCFVKPVKGAFSVMSGVFASREELAAFLRSERVAAFRSEFMAIFNRLARAHGLAHDGRWFIAEGLLRGRQATVEGWRARSGAGVLGVVDSVFQPGTRSFTSFQYPSSLPGEVQERMGAISERAAAHLGLVDTLYNVELTWDPDMDRIGIIEVNPRACGQFADLYQKVDGTNGYEVTLEVAVGGTPRPRRREGAFAAAASFPLRIYQPARVVRSPGLERIREVQTEHPGTLVLLECATGDLLTDFGELEDGQSHRYAVVNLGGDGPEDLQQRLSHVQGALGIELAPLEV